MKKIVTLLFLFTVSLGFSQEKKTTQIVEAACGQCKFGMTDKKGCDLAVRIDNKAYFVAGTTINDHGDAHSHDGFCSAIRKAEVTGEVKDNRFVATSFKLLPVEEHDDHKGHKH
ncbi:MAG: DUF6370 family protein [Bacteroidota bacterium]